MSNKEIPNGFKMTELGTLPEEWEVVRLGNVANYINGYAFKPSDWGIIGKPIIRIQNLNDKSKPYNFFDGALEDKYLVRNSDLLISWSASLGAFIWTGEEAWLNQHIFKVIIEKEKVDKDFLYFHTNHIIGRLMQKTRGSTMKHIVKKEFLNSKLALPSLPEQRAIANVLSTVQDAKEKTDAVITATKELKKSLMKHLFTYGPVSVEEAENVPLKETEIGMVPEVWDVVEVENIGEIITGRTPSTKKSEYYGSSHMFISPADIHEGRYVTKTNKGLSEKGLKVSRPLPRYTILVVCIGATIGKTAMTFVDNCTTNQQINAIISKGNVDPSHLYYSLNFHSHRLYPLAGGIGIPIINKSNFGNFKIPLPPPSIQQKIASTLSAVDKKIEAEENKKKSLEDLFKTLLNILMTGKLRVNHLEV